MFCFLMSSLNLDHSYCVKHVSGLLRREDSLVVSSWVGMLLHLLMIPTVCAEHDSGGHVRRAPNSTVQGRSIYPVLKTQVNRTTDRQGVLPTVSPSERSRHSNR